MPHGGDVYRNKVNMDFSVNLNPLGIPEEVKKAMKRSVGLADCYPDPGQERLREVLADALFVKSENVYAGNGASELLMAAVRAAAPKKALLFEPCFSGYAHVLKAAGCGVIRRIMDEKSGFTVSKEDLNSIGEDTDLIFAADPGSPAGLNLDEGILKELLDRAKNYRAGVILDESFYHLSDASFSATAGDALRIVTDRAADLIREYDNLFIIRSLTKLLAVPGVRCGYAIADAEMIDKLKMQLPEWNVSVASQEVMTAGVEVLTKTDFAVRSVRVIQERRRELSDALKDLGLTVFDSQSPYILFKGPEGLYKELLKRGILIRDCEDYGGLTRGYFRAAVRTQAENGMLINAVKEVMNGI